uniref:non-specific serine/threonine protein kinase n=1 Tax=Strongyloides venezuelensis TaxID=75913 RepID=A0A0K0FYG3_STRVS
MLKRFIGIGLKRRKKSEKGRKTPFKVDNKRSVSEESVAMSKYDITKRSCESNISNTKICSKKSLELETTKQLSNNKIKSVKKKTRKKSNPKEEKLIEAKKVKDVSKNLPETHSHNMNVSKNTYSKVKDSLNKEKIKSYSKNDVKKVVNVKQESIKDNKTSVKNNPNLTSPVKNGPESKVECNSKLEKETKLPKEPKSLVEGTMIAFNWEIKKTLGKGSFGQVYLGEHKQTHVKIAIKTLLASYQEFRIAMERDVLKLCSDKMYFPKVYLSGMHDIYYCIGMSLLGPSLTDIRKSTKTSKIEPQYCMIVCKQMIYALKTLHELGYVHRDIKPSNICTGYPGTPEAKNMCYLIDFGIVRKFIIGGVIIKPKGKGRLRGTMRYLSLNCHQLLELGPADDLHSLYYSIIELGTGLLPWKNCLDIKEVEKMKLEFDYSKHRGDLPSNFLQFWTITKDVTNIQFPDYAKCIEVVEECISNKFKGENFIFPWHDSPLP